MTVSTKRSSFSKNSFFLYAAYISTCLEDRAWSFCVSLCMELIGGLRVVSIEQLFEGVLQMFFSGHLGKIFDRFSRKIAIMTVVPFNNLSICFAAGLLVACLSIESNSTVYMICLILAMIICAINRLFLNAEKFIVGRDWVVVLGDNTTLSSYNATLTSLDQFTNVIAPLFTGALVQWLGLRTTVAIFGIGSLVSMASKTFFLRMIYVNNVALHHKSKNDEKNVILDAETEAETTPKHGVIGSYYYQATFPAAFGMALLFMTVLGFDGLAVGYGSSVGLPEFILGVFRSYGSVTGILGAISYAVFEKRFSVATSGMIGLLVQQVFVIMAVVSIWLPGSPMDLGGYFGNFTIQSWWHDMEHTFDQNNATNLKPDVDWKNFTSNGVSLDSIFVFLIGIASARYGLWCLDLAITHIMQVGIPATERNTVFGVHNALCSTFSVLKDILVIILPQSSTFAICIIISYGFVITGHLFFVYYLIKTGDFKAIGQRLKTGSEEEDDEFECVKL